MDKQVPAKFTYKLEFFQRKEKETIEEFQKRINDFSNGYIFLPSGTIQQVQGFGKFILTTSHLSFNGDILTAIDTLIVEKDVADKDRLLE